MSRTTTLELPCRVTRARLRLGAVFEAHEKLTGASDVGDALGNGFAEDVA
jgi:hypothetical protein